MSEIRPTTLEDMAEFLGQTDAIRASRRDPGPDGCEVELDPAAYALASRRGVNLAAGEPGSTALIREVGGRRWFAAKIEGGWIAGRCTVPGEGQFVHTAHPHVASHDGGRAA